MSRRQDDVTEKGAAFEARVELAKRARALEPEPGTKHWLAAWRLGRDAAVAAFDRGGVDAATELDPPADAPCVDCWRQGRDAAVEVLETT